MTKKDKLNRLAKAANLIRSAASALEEVAQDGGYIAADANYFRAELLEILDCDNGESGLDYLIGIVAKEIEWK